MVDVAWNIEFFVGVFSYISSVVSPNVAFNELAMFGTWVYLNNENNFYAYSDKLTLTFVVFKYVSTAPYSLPKYAGNQSL